MNHTMKTVGKNVYFILNRNKRIDVFSEKRMDKS